MAQLEDRQKQWKPTGIELETAALDTAKSLQHTLVVAGPGAGKTELLAQRTSYLLETGTCPPPYRILAISFKREAAQNLKERVLLRCGRSLAYRFDSLTFDAFAKDLLDRFRLCLPVELRPSADYEILTGAASGDEKLHEWMERLSSQHLPMNTRQRQEIPTASLAKALSFAPLPWSQWPPDRPVFKAAAGLWRGMLAAEPSSLTFRMVNRLAEYLVRENPEIRQVLRDTYRFVFLDEFQDTTPGQCELTESCFLGSDTILTAVGDNKQRIMGWAGALTGIFQRFKDKFDADVATLTQNHRSRSRLVEIQSVFAAALDPEAVPTESARSGEATGECRVLEFTDETHEAAHVATIIGELIEDGVPPEEICLLCRARPEQFAGRVIDQLRESGIKVCVEVNRREILGEPASALLVRMMELMFCAPAPDAWAFVTAVAAELGSDDEDSAIRRREKLIDFLETERAQLSQAAKDVATVHAALDRLLAHFDRGRFAALHPQYAQGDYLERVLHDLAELVTTELESCDWEDAVPAVQGVGAVSVMTMHKSKGLEFDTVFFLGLEDASIWGYANNPDEETCGLFVALSRAKDRCFFTYSAIRPDRYGRDRAQARLNLKRIYELFAEARVQVERLR